MIHFKTAVFIVLIYATFSKGIFVDYNLQQSDYFTFTFNPHTKLQIAINATADKVPLLDYTRNLSALYNGKTCGAFIFNYVKGEGVYIPGGSTDKTWCSSRSSFDEYFGNLDATSQEELWNLGEKQGIKFDPSTITEDISDKIGEILEDLSQDYADRCEALATFLQISSVVSNYFRSSMTGYSQAVGTVDTKFRGDFKWLVGIYKGMGEFFSEIPGGMSILTQHDIPLSLHRTFTEPTGFHVLIYFLELLQPHFNIGEILGHALNNEERFFALVNKLGGEVYNGFDGFVNVVTEIVDFNYGKSSKRNVRIVVSRYCESPVKSSSGFVRERWRSSLVDLTRVIKNLELADQLQNLDKLLQNILNGSWFENGINMSLIVEIVADMSESDCAESIRTVLDLLDIVI